MIDAPVSSRRCVGERRRAGLAPVDTGFRARRCAAPRNDDRVNQPDPGKSGAGVFTRPSSQADILRRGARVGSVPPPEVNPTPSAAANFGSLLSGPG
jgi:hypothetical protein